MPMILAANANAQGSHVGEWRHPDAWNNPASNIANAVRLAQIAEAGKMDLLFLADGNGVRQMDKPDLFAATSPSDRPGVFEPVTLLSALAMATRHIGLVATTTTTYDEPFHVARRFASLDHISGGRAGWNLVTTSNPGDALNFSHSEHVARDTRYERANEFADVVKGLWDSWADDAFPQDKATGRFLDPAKVHVLGHKGKHFKVAGPLNVPRPPQGHPVVFSAGQSEGGRELSARHADCIFAIEATLPAAQKLYGDFKDRLARYGRVPERDLVNELFRQRWPWLMSDAYRHSVRPPLSSSPRSRASPCARPTGAFCRKWPAICSRATPSRSPTSWRPGTGKGCDGFMIAAPVVPTGLERFTRLVVPELQRRGLFRREYEGRTLREHLGLKRPARRISG